MSDFCTKGRGRCGVNCLFRASKRRQPWLKSGILAGREAASRSPSWLCLLKPGEEFAGLPDFSLYQFSTYGKCTGPRASGSIWLPPVLPEQLVRDPRARGLQVLFRPLGKD